MSLVSFAFPLSVFWLIIYVLHRILGQGNHHESILPSYRRGLRSHAGICHFTIRFLHARIETSRWNAAHDKLLTRLKRKDESRSRAWLERIYTLGYVSGVIGMVVALGLLGWTAWTLMKPPSIHTITGVSKTVGKLMKRNDVSARLAYGEPALESPITPILPGVTVPMNHIPAILVALFLSQVVHELGHAVAGALYGIPILTSGVSITVCLPAAFVSFSSATLDTLRPSAKSRVIAAGPFHNLLFWCFWALAGYLGSGVFFALLGYKDVSSIGRVVLNVDEASPLVGYLVGGAIITKLNDQSMVSSLANSDPWGSFLKSPPDGGVDLGWCVDAKEFGSSSKECCLPDETLSTALSCFVANTTPNQIGCLDPIPVLTSTDATLRCASENDCKGGHVCLRPSEREGLLRLTVTGGEEKHENVVLWSGPRREIWDEVMVGRWLPRFAFLPISLPSWANIFWEYMMMVNLSLFLFNLVPIGGLDGTHFLRSVLASLTEDSKHETYDLEAMGRAEVEGAGGNGEGTWCRVLEKGISGGAGLLVAVNIVLAVFALIRT
ncbi:hypothetical protein P691DRAFT_776009 [Macrolepiota fuliginosa MF-IS2]|uniref:Endopeptidase S2P n=1 Tax=Macrolepiota fuliginosa MF-IS2 TaxID=1400762 RepID=A0A9P5XCM9_9AGAR|nr:hypothetical protein P691DRAFT_776009 [Macrolepiota fuliginosa MF-IS2]